MRQSRYVLLAMSCVFMHGTYCSSLYAQAADSGASPSEQEVAQDIARQAEELKKALLAKGPQFSLAGPVEILKGGLYSIGGEEFRINSETEIVGDLKPGAMTEARGPFKPKSPKIAAKVIVHDSKNTTAGAEQGNHSRVDGMR